MKSSKGSSGVKTRGEKKSPRTSNKSRPTPRGRRPFVAATFAMTVDGKITTKNFTPVDFTSREDKRHLLRQRALGDAVLIGRSTLTGDNVRLGLPDPAMRAEREARGRAPYPLRVIVSNEGRIDPALNLFQHDLSRILIFSTTRMPRKYQRALREKATLHLSETRTVDLAKVLQLLRAEYGVRRVACEGGAKIFRSLLELQLVDQLNLTIAPFIFGGKDAPTLTGRSLEFLPGSVCGKLIAMKTVGDECFLEYRLRYPRLRPSRLAGKFSRP